MKNDEKKKRIVSVDFFKGIAILMVLLCHAVQGYSLPLAVENGFRFGQMGCQVFFALSCFSLCLTYKRQSWFHFMKKRILRICVGWYLMIIVFMIIRIIKMNVIGGSSDFVQSVNPLGILANALFLNGLAVDSTINNLIVYGGWFVGAIVILWALFPFLYRIYERSKKHKIIMCFLCSLPCFFFVIVAGIISAVAPGFFSSSKDVLYSCFMNQLAPFCVGFLLFDYYERSTFATIKCRYMKFFLALAASLLSYYNPVFYFSFILTPFLVALSFFYCFAIFYPRLEKKILKSNIENIVIKFGRKSWGIYLTQSIVIFFLFKIILKLEKSIIHANDSFLLAINIPLILVSCYCVGVLFEEKVCKKIYNLTNRNKRKM